MSGVQQEQAEKEVGRISLVSPCARGTRHARLDGLPPTLVLCSRSAHAGPIIFLNYGRCSLHGRGWTSIGCRSMKTETIKLGRTI